MNTHRYTVVSQSCQAHTGYTLSQVYVYLPLTMKKGDSLALCLLHMCWREKSGMPDTQWYFAIRLPIPINLKGKP